MTNASKTGVTLTVIVAVLIVGLIWFMASTSRSRGANNLSFTTPDMYGDTSDPAIQSDLAKIDAQLSAVDKESRDMDSF